MARVRCEAQYDSVPKINEFLVHDLRMLAEPALKPLPFEDSPFTQHYEALLLIINANRLKADPLQDYVMVSDSDSVEPSTPPPLYEFDEPKNSPQHETTLSYKDPWVLTRGP